MDGCPDEERVNKLELEKANLLRETATRQAEGEAQSLATSAICSAIGIIAAKTPF